jgi:hypothetical protein
MPIIGKPVEILKNQDNIFTLDKVALGNESKVSSDPYFSDQANWKKVFVAYLTDVGNQVEFVDFDATLGSPTGNFRVSDKARDLWQVDALIIQDFDGGYLRFERSELTTAEFDVDFGAGPAPSFQYRNAILDGTQTIGQLGSVINAGNNLSTFTYAAWVYLDSNGNTDFENEIMNINSNTGTEKMYLTTEVDKTLKMRVGSTLNYRSVPIQYDQWVFIAVTFHSLLNSYTVYCNGQSNVLTYSTDMSNRGAQPIALYSNKITSYGFNGKVANTFLWYEGSAITKTDLDTLYNAGYITDPTDVGLSAPNHRYLFNDVEVSDTSVLINDQNGTNNLTFSTGISSFEDFTFAGYNPITAVSGGTFETSDTAFATAFNVVNGTETNKWEVGTVDSNTGTQSAYISTDGGTSAGYTISSPTNVHFYQDYVVNSGTPFFAFSAYAEGEYLSGSGTYYDYLEVNISTDFTTPISAGTIYIPNTSLLIKKIKIADTTQFEQYIENLSAYSGQTVRICFSWLNDLSAGSGNGAFVDDIGFTSEATL